MGLKSQVRLPSLSGWVQPAERPSVEQARDALGGRTQPGPRAGWGVVIDDQRHGLSPGVVLHDAGTELDVWIGEGLIARVSVALVASSLSEPAPARFEEVARDVLRFASMREGQDVVVLGPGPAFRAILREQCRYGALVERADDARSPRPVLAIGFRRLALLGP